MIKIKSGSNTTIAQKRFISHVVKEKKEVVIHYVSGSSSTIELLSAEEAQCICDKIERWLFSTKDNNLIIDLDLL